MNSAFPPGRSATYIVKNILLIEIDFEERKF